MEPGSIIKGTLQNQVILPTCMSIFYRCAPGAYQTMKKIIAEYDTTYSELLGDDNHPFWSSLPMASLLLDEVFDAMDKLAPEGHHFGPSLLDHTNLGFWTLNVTVTEVLDALASDLSNRNQELDEKNIAQLIGKIEHRVSQLKRFQEEVR